MGAWEQVAEIAGRQAGVVSYEQAVASGVAPRTLWRHVDRQGWIRLHPTVWGLPGTPDSYERDLWGALLAVRDVRGARAVGDDRHVQDTYRDKTPSGPLVTGESRLWLAGSCRRRPRTVHLWLPPRHHLHRRNGTRFFRGAWVASDEQAKCKGFPAVPLLRAFTDAAADSGVESLVRWIAEGCRLRLFTLEDLTAYLELRGRFPGIRRLRAALTQLGMELTHSVDERTARRLLRDAGLRPHPRPYPVVHDDSIVGEVDIAFPAVLYGAEIDGPHHLLPEVARADRARDRRLERLGWQIDRFTWQDVRETPQAFVNAVRAGLEAASVRARS